MDRKIWLAAGIAGMLLGTPTADARAEVNIRIGGGGDRPHFVMHRRPDFIYLPDIGFSVSRGAPYDILYYGDRYYLFNNGSWYRSSDYRGPWIIVSYSHLPSRIRRHHWDDIRRYRDNEYRRHDRRFDRRFDGDDRRDWRRDWRRDRYDRY